MTDPVGTERGNWASSIRCAAMAGMDGLCPTRTRSSSRCSSRRRSWLPDRHVGQEAPVHPERHVQVLDQGEDLRRLDRPDQRAHQDQPRPVHPPVQALEVLLGGVATLAGEGAGAVVQALGDVGIGLGVAHQVHLHGRHPLPGAAPQSKGMAEEGACVDPGDWQRSCSCCAASCRRAAWRRHRGGRRTGRRGHPGTGRRARADAVQGGRLPRLRAAPARRRRRRPPGRCGGCPRPATAARGRSRRRTPGCSGGPSRPRRCGWTPG